MSGNSIADDEVRVYAVRPEDVDVAAAEALLSEEERDWLRRFRFERHRREHLVSRALVRSSLARHLPEEGATFRFRLGECGKPVLHPPRDVFFNASNHPTLVVCALARHEQLGVDVEPISRGDEILEVAHTVFSPAELASLRRRSGDQRSRRAVDLWTMKEAYVKALGLGFLAPLREMTIDLDVHPHIVAGEAGWFLDARDYSGARIAIALRGAPSRPRIVLADGAELIAQGS